MQLNEKNRIMMEMDEMMDTINVVPMPGDPDHHFAMMMKTHHESAIKMAGIELADGHNDTIKQMAQLIIQKQKQEIAELEGFLHTHTPGNANLEFNMNMENCMESMDRQTRLQPVNGHVDHDFAMLMIAHHQSAIDMSNLVMCYGHDPNIQRLAREIVEDQQTEIAELKRWLSGHEC